MITTVDIVKRAQQLADISNTDFLTHSELTSYLNEAMQFVAQEIVNRNLHIFTATARLVGAHGVYTLPKDFWQLKAVKNPYSGQQILRKTESWPQNCAGYTMVNNTIVIDGFNPGPVEIVYYKTPYYLSLPNKTLEDMQLGTILDTAENNILYYKDTSLYIWTPNAVITIPGGYSSDNTYRLIRDEYILRNNNVVDVATGTTIWTGAAADYYIKSDDGLLYMGTLNDEGMIDIHKLSTHIATLPKPVDGATYVQIAHEFYEVPVGSFPVGLFDDTPAYTLDGNLYLITDQGHEAISLDLPIMKIDGQMKYGIISNNKVYSNVPNTALNLPNNVLYDLIAFRLAVYFLCKMNASSEGVEAQYTAMLQQFLDSLDAAAGYTRLNNVR